MNNAHKVAARKLRSLATAIRAESYAPHEFGVREAMEAEAVELERRADILAGPIRPTITEPTAFGSIIKARCESHSGLFWARTGGGYWVSDHVIGRGVYYAPWESLDVIEVLRVGVGEPTPEQVEGLRPEIDPDAWKAEVEAADAIEALVEKYAGPPGMRRGDVLFSRTSRPLHALLREFAIRVLEVGGRQPGVPVTYAMVETVCSRIYLTWGESRAESKRIARRDIRAALEAALLPKEPTS